LANRVRFNDIAGLSDRETQIFLRETDSKDLASAMKGARKPVQQRIFQNVSQRVASMLKEETASIDGSRSAALRGKCVETLNRLVEKGAIQWPPTGSEPKRRKLTKAYLDEKRRTVAGTNGLKTKAELDKWIVALANIARAEGVLELGNLKSESTDVLTATDVRFIVDGVEAGLVRSVLENLAESRLREQEVQYQKVIEGILAIQSGGNPRMIGQMVGAIY
jgi:hypothetical protein